LSKAYVEHYRWWLGGKVFYEVGEVAFVTDQLWVTNMSITQLDCTF